MRGMLLGLAFLAAPALAGGDKCLSAAGGGACGAAASPAINGFMLTSLVSGDDVKPAPGVWLGVNMTRVPAPLEAHLGRGGLMVGNIVRGSPADAAGLERYDVLVSLAGREVKTMDALLDVLREQESGAAVPVKLLRGGKEQVLTVKLAKRPSEPSTDYKYEEDEASMDALSRYFGHRVTKDDTGRWIIEPLGQLDKLPGILDNFVAVDPDAGNVVMVPNWGGPFSIRVNPGVGALGPGARYEMSMTVSENGKTLSVRRDADGVITVEKKDADGKESAAKYDSLEEFEEKDPDAYAVYSRATVSPWAGMQVSPMVPDLSNLRSDQRKWREDAERMLREAREAARRAEEQLRRKLGADDDSSTPNQAGTWSSSSGLKVHRSADGRFTVTVREGGDVTVHTFASEDEFKKAEPELYKKAKELMDTSNDR